MNKKQARNSIKELIKEKLNLQDQIRDIGAAAKLTWEDVDELTKSVVKEMRGT